MTTTLFQTYRYLLGYPKSILVIVCCLTLVATWQIRYFTFDASSDTLVVQGDPKLAVYFEMTELFGGDEFLVLTYSRQAKNTLFSEKSLAQLNILQKELVSSPLFNNFLISSDGESSVIQINLARDFELEKLRRQRDEARQTGSTTSSDELSILEEGFRVARKQYVESRERIIDRIREIREKHSQGANIFISGVPILQVCSSHSLAWFLPPQFHGVFTVTLVPLYRYPSQWLLPPLYYYSVY